MPHVLLAWLAVLWWLARLFDKCIIIIKLHGFVGDWWHRLVALPLEDALVLAIIAWWRVHDRLNSVHRELAHYTSEWKCILMKMLWWVQRFLIFSYKEIDPLHSGRFCLMHFANTSACLGGHLCVPTSSTTFKKNLISTQITELAFFLCVRALDACYDCHLHSNLEFDCRQILFFIIFDSFIA